MSSYRVRPSLTVIDEDKDWLVEKNEGDSWEVVFKGSYEKCIDEFYKLSTKDIVENDIKP